jgi:hypothetical protein
MNNNIKSWGGDAWHILHTIGLNTKVTPSNKKDFIIFLNNFKNILPCTVCRDSFIVKQNSLPISEDTVSNKEYQKWIYNIHNMVNDSIYKTKISFKDHIKLHKSFDTEKINKFSLMVISNLGNAPPFKEILECKVYLKYLIKLHPQNVKNKTKAIKDLNNISNAKLLHTWYNKYFK